MKICHEYGKDSKVFAADLDKTIADVVKLLRERGLSVATAESLTGGLLSERITSVAGASQVFELGICTYSDRMKRDMLAVPPEILQRYGAVSRETAYAMASGLSVRSGAGLSLAVTGIAGPDGGTREHPVGTVYAGFAFQGEVAATLLQLWELPELDRDGIRHNTAKCVFCIAKQLLEAEYFR